MVGACSSPAAAVAEEPKRVIMCDETIEQATRDACGDTCVC